MSKVYPVPPPFAAQANLTKPQYDEMYRRSIDDPDGFWSEQANKYLTWFKPWDKTLDWSFGQSDLHIQWFKGGKLNVSYNCLDRHVDPACRSGLNDAHPAVAAGVDVKRIGRLGEGEDRALWRNAGDLRDRDHRRYAKPLPGGRGREAVNIDQPDVHAQLRMWAKSSNGWEMLIARVWGRLRLYCRIEDPTHVVDVDEIGEEGAEIHEFRIMWVVEP